MKWILLCNVFCGGYEPPLPTSLPELKIRITAVNADMLAKVWDTFDYLETFQSEHIERI